MSVSPAMQAQALSRQGIESLRGRKDPEAVKAVAREMESLFAYEMIKAMRAASKTSAAGGSGGLGGEMYGSLFDMELARLMSSRGLGLQEMILKGMRQVEHQGGKEAVPEGADASPPAAVPFGSSKWYALPSRAGSGNVSGVSGFKNTVSALAAAPPAAKTPPSAARPSVAQTPLSGVLSPGLPKRHGIPAAAGFGNVFAPESAYNIVSGQAAPPAATAAAETAPASPPGNVRPAPPDFVSRISDFVSRMSGATDKTAPIPPGEWSPPIREEGRVSSPFGYRKDPFTGARKFHHGIDIAAAAGAKVHPVKSGEVLFSGYRKGYGNIVEIGHGDGLVTMYAHNRANHASVGDKVSPDTVIAEVGSTGRSTAPHLHFEVRRNGQKISPKMVFSGISKGRG